MLLCFSCTKWLDVKPKAEIKADVMFETEQGFKDALIGCYIMMGDRKIYGLEMTNTYLDVLAQQYLFNGSTSSAYYNAAQYRHDLYIGRIDGMWNKIYNVITNINNIIENIELRKDLMHPTNYAVIKAEAHGLRAFLHFDLIRMFGYGDLRNNPQYLDLPCIAYSKSYSKIIPKQLTMRQVLAAINEDLDISIALLQNYDPISRNAQRPDGYDYPNQDKFYSDRSYRFNYNAALATRMRVKQWEGDDEEVLKIADYIIKKANINWIAQSNINNADQKQRDLSFSSEQLFGLELFKRFEDVKLYFKLTVNDNLNMNYQCLYLTKSAVDSRFEVSTVGASDYRYTRQIEKPSSDCYIVKYWEYEGMNEIYTNNQPLIRKPEIYYAAAECLNRTGSNDDKIAAISYLNQVRNARGIPYDKNLPNTLTQTEVSTEIEKEWRKEFIGEGQLFFFYKRLGYTTIPGSNMPMTTKTYVFPYPINDINVGGFVDPNKKDETK